MQPESILQRYHLPAITRIHALGNAGGFSGARIWRLETKAAEYCLRRWPNSQRPQRLRFMHHVLTHVAATGLTEIAVPIPNLRGETMTEVNQDYFELSRWMPGAANYRQQPGTTKLVSALTFLANFHVAAATCPNFPVCHRPSDAIVERLRILEQLQRTERDQIEAKVASAPWPELRFRANEVLRRFDESAPALRARLQQFEHVPVPNQVVIRDIWHDHVLYTGDQVTGVVDFGAMRVDTVALDIARLIGSLARSPADWSVALAAYRDAGPHSPPIAKWLGVFSDSFHVLAGMIWLKWICVDGRTFEDNDRVLDRIDAILQHERAANVDY